MQTFIITGTDTGVGKTVLTLLLARFLRARASKAIALKPISSGNRSDARKIFAAAGKALTLDEINPHHFHAPIAPLLAARRENKKVKLEEVLKHICAMQKSFDVLLVEGAGGLLSPLGENFDSRDLIVKLRAIPIIVSQNRLGAVNQILLTLEALPENLKSKTHVVLMSPEKPDSAAGLNKKLLAEFFDGKRIFELPWLGKNFDADEALKKSRVKEIVVAIVKP